MASSVQIHKDNSVAQNSSDIALAMTTMYLLPNVAFATQTYGHLVLRHSSNWSVRPDAECLSHLAAGEGFPDRGRTRREPDATEQQDERLTGGF